MEEEIFNKDNLLNDNNNNIDDDAFLSMVQMNVV